MMPPSALQQLSKYMQLLLRIYNLNRWSPSYLSHHRRPRNSQSLAVRDSPSQDTIQRWCRRLLF